MTSAMSLQRMRAKSCKRVNHKFTLNFLKAPELGSEKMAHDAACSKVTTRMLQCKMVKLTDRISQTPCKQSRALSLAHTCGLCQRWRKETCHRELMPAAMLPVSSLLNPQQTTERSDSRPQVRNKPPLNESKVPSAGYHAGCLSIGMAEVTCHVQLGNRHGVNVWRGSPSWLRLFRD